MEKDLLPKLPFYKAALHTHSTMSDGKQTPEEVKKAHKERGYQILCITDHNINVSYPELNEPDFLMLTGMEINTRQYGGWDVFNDKTYHLLFIAKEPDNLWQPLPRWGETADRPGWAEQAEKMCLEYDIQAVNALIARGNEKGFLCAYCHPTWSRQDYRDYAPLEGLWGMELCNSGSQFAYDSYNGNIYRELCALGKSIMPLGTDDSHSEPRIGLAWTMVGAPELSYQSVIAALEKGDLYMSTGPEIHSLTIEGETLHIACSPAAKIHLETGNRWAKAIVGEDGPITQADISLSYWLKNSYGQEDSFLWLTITAPDGTYAATRAYRRKELMETS